MDRRSKSGASRVVEETTPAGPAGNATSHLSTCPAAALPSLPSVLHCRRTLSLSLSPGGPREPMRLLSRAQPAALAVMCCSRTARQGSKDEGRTSTRHAAASQPRRWPLSRRSRGCAGSAATSLRAALLSRGTQQHRDCRHCMVPARACVSISACSTCILAARRLHSSDLQVEEGGFAPFFRVGLPEPLQAAPQGIGAGAVLLPLAEGAPITAGLNRAQGVVACPPHVPGAVQHHRGAHFWGQQPFDGLWAF